MAEARILLYDGECGLCARSVRFVLSHERGERALRFAPLGGVTARGHGITGGEGTVILLDAGAGRRWVRSAAVVRVLWGMGGAWRAVGALFWLVPLPLRDLGYALVAAVRRRIWPMTDSCALPPPGASPRFLP